MLLMQNCPQYAVAFYAALRAQAVVVPVNPMNRADELGHYIVDPQTKLAVVAADLAASLAQANSALPAQQKLKTMLVAHYAHALPAPTGAPPMPQAMAAWLYGVHSLPKGAHDWQDVMREATGQGLQPKPYAGHCDDLAILPYTSGTTALPKGCMHTHRTLLPNIVGGALWGQVSAESVGLAVVPMFHITGMMYGLHTALWSGNTMVLMPRWDRELAAALIAQHRVTHWTCIPTMLIDMLGSPNIASFELSSLQYLSGGGAAMPQAVAERLKLEFGLVFAEGYGLTETAAPSHANPIERAKQQCLGMPYFGVDARVIDPQTLAPMPVGEVGEIVIHGPMVFKGYWGHPQATQDAFITIDGKAFFRSGDLGRVDEEGYFFITDRLKRMINASGFKVWPSEVELMLFKHPAVQEACVIATRDAYRGESVKAMVVLRPSHKEGATPATIIDWAREHMAAYKVPKQVEFVESLPKSGSGKVMWRLLQDQENARSVPTA
jgi:fatty-acyl-CoA synthase